MNQQVFSKFNLYDQIGYFLVGSIALLVIYLDTVMTNHKFVPFDLKMSFIWIIVATRGRVMKQIVTTHRPLSQHKHVDPTAAASVYSYRMSSVLIEESGR